MKNIIISIIFGLFTIGCQSTNETVKVESACGHWNGAPEWVCSAENGLDRSMYDKAAYGVNDSAVGSLSHRRTLAIMDARNMLAGDITSILESTLENIETTSHDTKTGKNDTATNQLSQIISSIKSKNQMNQTIKSVLVNTTIISEQRSPDGAIYILIGLKKGAVSKLVEQVVNASELDNTNLVMDDAKKQLSNELKAAFQ